MSDDLMQQRTEEMSSLSEAVNRWIFRAVVWTKPGQEQTPEAPVAEFTHGARRFSKLER
jgi:hypothetical protein